VLVPWLKISISQPTTQKAGCDPPPHALIHRAGEVHDSFEKISHQTINDAGVLQETLTRLVRIPNESNGNQSRPRRRPRQAAAILNGPFTLFEQSYRLTCYRQPLLNGVGNGSFLSKIHPPT
jgi:hypothetical protein